MGKDMILVTLLICIYAITIICLPIMRKIAGERIGRLDSQKFKKILNQSEWVPLSLSDPSGRLEIYDSDYPPPYIKSKLGFLRDIRSAGGLGILGAVAWLFFVPFIIIFAFIFPSTEGPNIFAIIAFSIIVAVTGAATLYEFYCIFRLYAIRSRVMNGTIGPGEDTKRNL